MQTSKKRKVWADGAVKVATDGSGVRLQLLDEAGGCVYKPRSFGQDALRALLAGDEYLLEGCAAALADCVGWLKERRDV